MRTTAIAVAIAFASVLTLPNIVLAQTSATGTATNGAPAAYSTQTTDIGTLLDDPASKAVVDKYLPNLSKSDQIQMARGMTLKDIQQYSPDKITDSALSKIDADLAKLPKK